MKEYRNLLSISLLLLVFITVSGFSDNTIDLHKTKKIVDDEDPVFWFFVRVRVDTRKKVYTVISTTRVTSGTVKRFKKNIWRGLAKKRVAIGPFIDGIEAEKARHLFKISRKKVKRIPAKPDEVHWFLITFKPLKRARAFRLERMPARVASGSPTEFVDALYEGITFQSLAIGPFSEYTTAEDSKNMYRENE